MCLDTAYKRCDVEIECIFIMLYGFVDILNHCGL